MAEVVAAVEELARPQWAESWDRVGLRWGQPEARVTTLRLAIDLTPAVLAEAVAAGAEMVVAYHPPLWAPRAEAALDEVAQAAIAAGIAAYSPHTAWDAAPGGANDCVADLIGLRARQPLRAYLPDPDEMLSFTCPPAATEGVCAALEAAGCGEIGAYRGCSFRCRGVGAFVPQAGAHPHTGAVGRPEHAEEDEVTIRVPKRLRAAALAALRRDHPYEEPAFYFLQRVAEPDQAIGQGRVGEVVGDLAEIAARLKAGLGVRHLLVSLPPGGSLADRPGRAAVVVGAGGALAPAARLAGAALLVTGELDHHRVLAAAQGGLAVVATLHSPGERLGLRRLAQRLAAAPALRGVDVAVSGVDCEPWQVV